MLWVWKRDYWAPSLGPGVSLRLCIKIFLGWSAGSSWKYRCPGHSQDSDRNGVRAAQASGLYRLLGWFWWVARDQTDPFDFDKIVDCPGYVLFKKWCMFCSTESNTISHTLSYYVFLKSLWVQYWRPHLIDKDTEAKRSEESWLSFHGW